VRVVLDWVHLQDQADLRFHFALAKEGPLAGWIAANGIPHTVGEMPWFGWSGALTSARAVLSVAARARRWQIDVVHSEHNVYPFAVAVAALIRRPIVCAAHFLLDRGFVEWAFTGWRRPDRLIWTSHAQQAACREAMSGILPEERQTVIPLGVNLERFGNDNGSRDSLRRGWKATSDTIVVGQANAIRPGKRVEDFLRLVRELRMRDPRVLGVIAGTPSKGDEEYAAEMRALTTTLGLERDCLWLGNLEPVEPFLHAIDVFVSTSEYETFGMSICEAMACSRPVAVYRAGAPGEVVGDAGLVVETGDLTGLVEAARTLIDNADLRSTLGQRGRARVEAVFNPRSSLQTLARLYRSLDRARTGSSS
jgi:glycosyltransferase involved in cell wall biosynthesis